MSETGQRTPTEDKAQQDKGGADSGGKDGKEPASAAQAQPGSGLSRKERQIVKESVKPRAAVVYEIIRREGEAELHRPASALWWSGVAAGISIGFSFITEAALAAHLPESAWTPIVAKLGYAVGFIIVILGQQQLFTENVLTAVLPLMAQRRLKWLYRMLRLWGIVFAANLAGCFVFALAFAKLPLAEGEMVIAMNHIVEVLMQNSAIEMFAKGIGAGWLIAALVWILAANEHGEFYIITLLTYLIALFGFTHIVAGSAEAFYGYLHGLLTLEELVFKFQIPTLAGNVFGGTVLFSVLSYAQVRDEIFVRKDDD